MPYSSVRTRQLVELMNYLYLFVLRLERAQGYVVPALFAEWVDGWVGLMSATSKWSFLGHMLTTVMPLHACAGLGVRHPVLFLVLFHKHRNTQQANPKIKELGEIVTSSHGYSH